MNCPVCWIRRRVQTRRARIVTELRLADGSIKRTDVPLRLHREARPVWPPDANLVFTAVAYGRRAARRMTVEKMREDWERWAPRWPVAK